MKKSLWFAALTIFAIAGIFSCHQKAKAGVGLFLTNAYAQVPAQEAVPAKKANLKIAKGKVTEADENTLAFTLEREKKGGAITFKAEPKMIEGLEAGDKVKVVYETLPNGENRAVRIKKVK